MTLNEYVRLLEKRIASRRKVGGPGDPVALALEDVVTELGILINPEAFTHTGRFSASGKRPARDGIEAQHGLNDIFPGDPYPP